MNQSTVTALIILESAGLVISLGFLGAAIYFGIKAKKEAELMKGKYNAAKQEFVDFANNLQNIFSN